MCVQCFLVYRALSHVLRSFYSQATWQMPRQKEDSIYTVLRQQSMLLRAQALESEDLGKKSSSDKFWRPDPKTIKLQYSFVGTISFLEGILQ